MATDHIETRTPEQMLRDAYRRCIECGEYYIKDWPGVTYGIATEYVFSHEKSPYRYVRSIKMTLVGVEQYMFRRISDDAVLVMTKYSEHPKLVSN